MKLGLREKIITEYKASKKETLLIWVIMLAVSVSIGLSSIMLNSQQIERSLMKNIDIRLEADGGHIFDCKYIGEMPTRKRLLSDVRGPELFCSFYRELVEFGKHEGIVDYGYSLGTDQAVLTKNNEELSNTNTMYRMLGISSPNYQTNEQIELIAGRFFTEDEITNKSYKIVVDEALTVDGEKINVGDKIIVNIASTPRYSGGEVIVYRYYSAEAEVIGIYKHNKVFDYSFGRQDAFLNNHCILIPEGVMEEAFIDGEVLDFNVIFLNNVWFRLESFENYYSSNYEFFKIVSTGSARVFTLTGGGSNAGSLMVKEDNPSLLKVRQNDYATVMRSVDKTSNFYFVVFAVGTATSVVLMAVMMTFILNRKIREINIYYSLGQNRKGINGRYAAYYCAVGLVASLVGYGLAYGLSQLLFSQLVRSSATVQAELAELSNSGAEIPITVLKLLGMKGSELALSGVISVAGLLIIVAVTVCLSLLSILHGNIRDKINNGV